MRRLNKKGNSTKLFASIVIFWFTVTFISLAVGQKAVEGVAKSGLTTKEMRAIKINQNSGSWMGAVSNVWIYIRLLSKIMFFQISGVPTYLVIWFNIFTILSFYSLVLVLRGVGS